MRKALTAIRYAAFKYSKICAIICRSISEYSCIDKLKKKNQLSLDIRIAFGIGCKTIGKMFALNLMR